VTDSGSVQYHLEYRGADSDEFRGYIDDGSDNVNIDSATTAISDNNWHHIVLTVDRDTTDEGKIYVDGAQSGSTTDISSVTGSISPSDDFSIGSIGSSSYYKGNIDEVVVYDRALDDDEVRMRHGCDYDAAGNLIRDHRGYRYFYENESASAKY